MTCRSLIQALSICGIAVTLAACGVTEQGGMSRDSGDFAIRGGDVITTPAEGNRPDNPAEYVVMISTKNTTCTGSLIGRRMVLTAAHCLPGVKEASEIAISFGLAGDKNFMGAEDFLVHPGYIQEASAAIDNPHDLALIELDQDAPKEYRVLELSTNLIMPSEMTITAVGYGKTHGKYDDKDSGAGILRKLDLKLFVENQNTPLLFFSQLQEKGFCNGDSGSPAVFRHIGRYYVVGVASHNQMHLPTEMKNMLIETNFNYEVVLSRFPNVDTCRGRGAYVNVKSYSKWITDTSQALLKAPAPESL